MNTLMLATTSLQPRRRGHGKAFVSALRASQCAHLLAEGFLRYDTDFRELTRRAPERFATLDWQGSQIDAAERIEIYPAQVGRTAGELRARFAAQIDDALFWEDVVRHVDILADNRANGELCRAFCQSVVLELGRSAATAFLPGFRASAGEFDPSFEAAGVRRVAEGARLEGLVEQLLRSVPLECEWDDPAANRRWIMQSLARHRDLLQTIGEPRSIETLDCVFYRFTRAYVVGCFRGIGGRVAFALELKNGDDGAKVQHLLLGAGSVNSLFRFAGAAFHAEIDHPLETAAYLQMLLPDLATGDFLALIGRPGQESITLAG